jgi:hypothetical protein
VPLGQAVDRDRREQVDPRTQLDRELLFLSRSAKKSNSLPLNSEELVSPLSLVMTRPTFDSFIPSSAGIVSPGTAFARSHASGRNPMR